MFNRKKKMSNLTEKIIHIPEPKEFLRRLRNISYSSEKVAQSDDYMTTEIEYSENDKALCIKYDDGSGNEYTVVVTKEGVFVWGFDHESEHSIYNQEVELENQEVLQDVPEQFSWVLTEKTFSWDSPEDNPHILATIAFWSTDNKTWNYSPKLENFDEYDDGGFKYFFKHIINYSSEKYVTYLRNLHQDITDEKALQMKTIFDRA